MPTRGGGTPARGAGMVFRPLPVEFNRKQEIRSVERGYLSIAAVRGLTCSRRETT